MAMASKDELIEGKDRICTCTRVHTLVPSSFSPFHQDLESTEQ